MGSAKSSRADQKGARDLVGRSLKKKLCTQLNQARRIGANDSSKRRTADIAVDGLGSEELGMIENIETFEPELEGLRFG